METVSKQLEYFKKLIKDREDNAKTLEKPSMKGIRRSVIDKYSDQAHFIYELLQNADDAKATKSKFVLNENELIFSHNGTINFTVSNPDTEEKDTSENQLGHINAITSIANSNKNESSIGKFGLGFKAVFQYTNTPHIYDPNFKFKIERFIVPQLLTNDIKREKNDTVFIFPFDIKQKPKEDAFSEIIEKLKSLVYPVLFLSNLEEVVWETGEEKGMYGKIIKETKKRDDTICQLINLIDKKDEKQNKKSLWLFTRVIERENYKYSVGFFLDKENKLEPVNHTAFCYFPTKETTNLKFIIQAPFLLTDSREGIKAAEKWNKSLISMLSALSADSLSLLKQIGIESENILIDDNIINIIPYKESDFSEIEDRSKISFKDFFISIKEKLKSDEILPAKDDTYSNKDNAYWAEYSPIANLFSNEQLAFLTNKENAKWVFSSISRNEAKYKGNRDLGNYIEDLVFDFLDIENILKKYISDTFIKEQTFEWLHRFYEYLSKSNEYLKIVKTKPIFIDNQGKPVSAFEQHGKDYYPILFLPSEYSGSTYKHIHPDLLLNDKSREFIENFGIKNPSLRDEINNILQLYENDEEIDTETHFQKFFKYYKDECPQNDINNFINLIKDKEFVSYKTIEDTTVYRGVANEIYFPSEDLKKYFETKPSTKFIDLETYNRFIGINDREIFEEYLSKIGVEKLPRILKVEITDLEVKNRLSLERSTYGYLYRNQTLDKIIDGGNEIMEEISLERSQLLWKFLCKLQDEKYDLDHNLKGEHMYFKYSQKNQFFESSQLKNLKTKKWLFTQNENIVAPYEINISELNKSYNTNYKEIDEIEKLLGFKPTIILTEDEKILKHIKGRSEEEIKKALELYDKKNKPNTNQTNFDFDPDENPIDKTYQKIKQKIKESKTDSETEKEKTETLSSKHEMDQESKDEDEYTKPSIDFDKQIQRKEELLKAEIEELSRIQELTDTAKNSDKYSFLWFKCLLELEYLNSSENNTKGKEVSIQFTKVEKEYGTERTIVLKHPNRYIPQSIEDIGDLTARLFFGNESRSVSIEVVNVKEYTLRAKLKPLIDISDIDLSSIYKVVIDIKNPVFLIDELRKNFNRLPFEDTYNLKQNLSPNIEFIFGPPGTGKTTYLAKDVLIPLMQDENNLKILVLTPTNKAADVLTRKIIGIMNGDESYCNWLVRFGLTGDAKIEQSSIFRDKTFDIRTKPNNVTVTTIARFPYDYFQLKNSENRLHLRELTWDYIVIDEASMIPIANILFPIYYKNDSKFIIAGDPFQIQPITSVEDWKDENIYTLVELNKFSNPTTVPHSYKVINLKTQYRSIPSIGNIFSHFTYEGILNHQRLENTKRPLNINGIDVKALNIIKFPVSPFDSIYRSKRLNKTPYHIYSAIFTFELTKYLSEQIIKNHKKPYRIGVICPYRAQASLVEKLFASLPFETTNVDIQIGTIHGFQGDECDIIISLFNPPPNIPPEKNNSGKKSGMFLHKQNILNVSISRARDYLFILMPDEETENLFNLEKVNEIERLISKSDSKDVTNKHSRDIEKAIFNNESFIEENSFSTTHQSVNVYSEAEKLFEIRCEDTAIDIQVSKRKRLFRNKNLVRDIHSNKIK